MVNKEFFAALADLVKEKGISEEAFIETLQNALASAYKKQYDGGAEVSVELDPESGTIEFKAIQHVVAEVTDRDKEISLEEAQELDPAYKEGDEIVRSFVPKDFGRIAAQTAKQVILQKLHETERDNTFSAFSDKEGELMEGFIRKVDDKNISVELGEKKIEGVMLPQDQTPAERYVMGDRLKVFVKRVKNSGKNSQILVSRAAPGLVKKPCLRSRCPKSRRGSWRSRPSPANPATVRKWRSVPTIRASMPWAPAWEIKARGSTPS